MVNHIDPVRAHKPCGGCGNADPEKVCVGCLHDFGGTLASAPPSGPVGVEAELRKLCSWKHLMSYNESYFGEPEGELKSSVYAIERALAQQPAAPDSPIDAWARKEAGKMADQLRDLGEHIQRRIDQLEQPAAPSGEQAWPIIGEKYLVWLNGVLQHEIYTFDQGDSEPYGSAPMFWSRDGLDECPLFDPEKDQWLSLSEIKAAIAQQPAGVTQPGAGEVSNGAWRSAAVALSREELDTCRQWFDSVQDTNGGYLTPDDYVLAEKLYRSVGMRVPDSIGRVAAQPGGSDNG